jgi:hypothetical protein
MMIITIILCQNSIYLPYFNIFIEYLVYNYNNLIDKITIIV